MLLLLIHTPPSHSLPFSAPAHAPFLRVVEIAPRRSSNSSHPHPHPHCRQAFPAFFTHAFSSILHPFSLSLISLFIICCSPLASCNIFLFIRPLHHIIFLHVTFSNSFFVSSSVSCCRPTTRMGEERNKPAKLSFVVAGII